MIPRKEVTAFIIAVEDMDDTPQDKQKIFDILIDKTLDAYVSYKASRIMLINDLRDLVNALHDANTRAENTNKMNPIQSMYFRAIYLLCKEASDKEINLSEEDIQKFDKFSFMGGTLGDFIRETMGVCDSIYNLFIYRSQEKVFRKANEIGYIKKAGGKYEWHYKKKNESGYHASLAYFVGRLINAHLENEKIVYEGKNGVNFETIGKFFDVDRLADKYRGAMSSKKQQPWRAEIDKLYNMIQ